MASDPCPSRDPLTDTPCMLADDRLDHGSVGHIAEGPRARVMWRVTAADTDRWATQDGKVRRIAGHTAPSAADLLEHRPRLRDLLQEGRA